MNILAALIAAVLFIPAPPAPLPRCVLRAQFFESPADYAVAAGIICQVSVYRDGGYETFYADGERDNIIVSGIRTYQVFIDAPGAEFIAVYSGDPDPLEHQFFLPSITK